MALVLRGTTKFGTNTGLFQGNPTGAKPSGTVEGDLIVIWFSGDTSARPSVTWPSGFTAIYDQNDTDLGGGSWIYGAYKVAGASEPSTYTVDITTGFYMGGSRCSIISYYNDVGVGSWNLVTRAANDVSNGSSITSPAVTGTGLYMIAFNHESNATVNTNNSPVSSILFDNSSTPASPTSSQIYAGYAAVSSGTVTVTWTTSATATDLYSVPVIFESTAAASGYISKIKVGSAYKNILDGWVAVDSTSSGSPDVWKKITTGHISVEDSTGDDVWVDIFKD
tara:strand:+ start:157 stop:996 length:840 start_codon:yes stop_codon:yes gene_type:complete